MRRLCIAAAGFLLIAGGAAPAQTVYPIDRAEMLAGSRFDFKVEFPGLADPAKVAVTLNGDDYAKVFGKAAVFVAREDDEPRSALHPTRCVAPRSPAPMRCAPAMASIPARSHGRSTKPARARRRMSSFSSATACRPRTAPRRASYAKGISEGKASGKLVIDDMPHMALVATAGINSIITNSANSMSAYTTGHKSATNAMGVYADRTRDPLDDPKVENITQSGAAPARRLAVGVVTNTEIEDATPAAMVAHTRRRTEYDRIVEHFFAAKPDVIMGGGLANFLPKSAAGSKRKDDVDFVARYRDVGYPVALTAEAMKAAAAAPANTKLLGLFHTGNMDGALNHSFKGGTVAEFPHQPDLTEQVSAALQVLSRNDTGFYPDEGQSGLIDKYTHLLDMERAVYDTVVLDGQMLCVWRSIGRASMATTRSFWWSRS